MSSKAKIIALVIVAAVIILVVWLVKSQPHYANIDSPRPIAGNKDAAIVVEEFSDFQCPACRAAQDTVQSLIKTYGNDISFHYRYFPLISIHPNGFSSALAAECANDQGKFWEYHDLLFPNQENLSQATLIKLAGDVKMDVPLFTACLKSRAKSSVVSADLAEGERRGVDSTPSFFVNGNLVADWNSLSSVIGELVAKTATSTATTTPSKQ